MISGKVYLVGAGPGDSLLLTLKAKSIIDKVDTIVVDALVGDEILCEIIHKKEIHYAGKRQGKHSMKQDEINNLLVSLAKEGKNVLRLKGGDPFVFGRGGEEALYLRDNNIPYEIIPGITSSISVPLNCGIPVTHREISRGFTVVTAFSLNNNHLDYENLAKSNNTLIFLMGVNMAGEISERLIANGRNENTPIAFLSNGTTSLENCVTGELKNLDSLVNSVENNTPGIIVVGEVVKLQKKLDFKEYLPLHNKKLIITRPTDNNRTTFNKLKALGAEVISLPSIKTTLIKNNYTLKEELEKNPTWLVFLSPTSIKMFFKSIEDLEIDIRTIKSKIAVIGQSTLREIKSHGIFPDLVSTKPFGKILGEDLRLILNDNDKVLIPRGDIINNEINEVLKNICSVTNIPIFTKTYINYNNDLINKVLSNFDGVLFSSISTVNGFLNYYKGDKKDFKSFAIGKTTGTYLKEKGFDVIESDYPTMDSLINTVVSYYLIHIE